MFWSPEQCSCVSPNPRTLDLWQSRIDVFKQRRSKSGTKQIWGRNLCDWRWHPDGQRCGIESWSCTLAHVCSHHGGWQWNDPKMLPILDITHLGRRSKFGQQWGRITRFSKHIMKRSGGRYIINTTRILSDWPGCGTRHSRGLCERVIDDHRCDVSSKQRGLGVESVESVESVVGQCIFGGSAFR